MQLNWYGQGLSQLLLLWSLGVPEGGWDALALPSQVRASPEAGGSLRQEAWV